MTKLECITTYVTLFGSIERIDTGSSSVCCQHAASNPPRPVMRAIVAVTYRDATSYQIITPPDFVHRIAGTAANGDILRANTPAVTQGTYHPKIIANDEMDDECEGHAILIGKVKP